jgi:hypothetical protein
MNNLFISSILASHDFPPGFYIPIAAMIFSLVIVTVTSLAKAHKRRLEHETIRIALEKGQPLPPNIFVEQTERRSCSPNRDRRAGVILVAIAVGLFGFLFAVAPERVYAVALIPGLIGTALLINSSLDAKQPPTQNRS